VTSVAQLLPRIGVKVGVASHRRLPSTFKIDLQRELDRIRGSLSLIEQRLVEADADAESGTDALPEDAVVDQRSVPAPKDLFLRMARRGDFPSQKHGKRVVARWGDVRRALLSGPDIRKVAPETDPGDGLDVLRRQMGLAARAK
jgi:hypothetical protein